MVVLFEFQYVEESSILDLSVASMIQSDISVMSYGSNLSLDLAVQSSPVQSGTRSQPATDSFDEDPLPLPSPASVSALSVLADLAVQSSPVQSGSRPAPDTFDEDPLADAYMEPVVSTRIFH